MKSQEKNLSDRLTLSRLLFFCHITNYPNEKCYKQQRFYFASVIYKNIVYQYRLLLGRYEKYYFFASLHKSLGNNILYKKYFLFLSFFFFINRNLRLLFININHRILNTLFIERSIS